MSIIARLGVVLGLNSAEFTKGLDDATKKTRDFEKNQKKALKDAERASADMAATFGKAGLAAVALAAGFVKVVQAADELSDTAAALDMTLESLIASKAALQAAGGEAANFSTMMTKLAATQDGAREGSDQLREAFERLGISGKDVDSLNLEEMFNRVASELAKVDDVTKRTALAQDLLGKAAKGVNWADFVSQYKQVADPALATAIRENAEAWGNIESTMKSIDMLVQKLTAPFSALLNMMFDLVKTYNDIKNGGDANIDFGAAFGGMPGDDGATITFEGKGAPKSNSQIAKPGQKGGYSQQSEKEKAAAEAERKRREREMQEMIANMRKFDDLFAKQFGLMQSMGTIQDQKLMNLANEYNISFKLLDLESKKINMTTDEYENAKFLLEQKIRILNVDKEAADAIGQARAELERASADEMWFAKQVYDEKVKNIEEIRFLQKENIEEYNRLELKAFDERLDRQYDFVAGFKASMKQAKEDNEKVFKLGSEAFSSIMGNMESAIQQFVKTGKLSFKDFARSIISDLLAIAIKAQAISLFSKLFASSFSVNVGPLSSDLSTPWKGQGLPGMASGGAIDGPRLVGENGPELFVPSSPGTVIPHGSWQQMATSQGGMTINGPYIANLSTIDSKSFEDRIYESSRAVWSAGKYAEKTLAVSGGRA